MTYVLNRLLSVILTLFLITLVTFAVTNILPGDVAMMIMGTQSNPEALAGLRQSLGLNDPILVQYAQIAITLPVELRIERILAFWKAQSTWITKLINLDWNSYHIM